MPTTKKPPSQSTQKTPNPSTKSSSQQQNRSFKDVAPTLENPSPYISQFVPYHMEVSTDHNLLDDSSMIQDILVTQKTLVKRYSNAVCEGSLEKFRKICTHHLAEVASDQFDSFSYMQKKNLYPIEPAPMQKLSEAKTKFKDKEQCMKKN